MQYIHKRECLLNRLNVFICDISEQNGVLTLFSVNNQVYHHLQLECVFKILCKHPKQVIIDSYSNR